MSDNKSTADRIRPILEAMERSIDSARNKRTERSKPGRQQPDERCSQTAGRDPHPDNRAAAQHDVNPPRMQDPPTTIGRGNGHPSATPKLPDHRPSVNPHQQPDSSGRMKAKPKRPVNFNSEQTDFPYRSAS